MALKEDKKRSKQPIQVSVGMRVLVICFTFVILPMIVQSFFMYSAYYKQKLYDHLNNIEIIGESDHYADVLWIQFMKASLDAISHIPPSTERYRTIAQKEDYTALYYIVKNAQGIYESKAANVPERGGSIPTLFEAFTKMKPNSFKFMGGFDPLTNIPSDFVAYMNEQGEIFLLIQGIREWVTAEREYLTFQRVFDLSVVTDTGVILYSTNPKFSLEKLEVVPFKEFAKSHKLLSETKKEFIGGKQPSLETNYYLYVTFPRAVLREGILNRVFVNMLIFSVLIIVFGGGAVLFLERLLQRPLNQLYRVMRSVKEGDLNVRYRQSSMGFEINRVGKYFNATVDHLVSYMRSEEEERVQKERLQTQLSIAREIQMSLFPEKLPSFPKLDIASSFLPAKIISGDFFDFFPLGERLLFLVADASGKGVPSALYSLAVRSFVRSVSLANSDLKSIIEMTNHLFCQDTKEQGAFVTAWFGVYDPNKETLTYNSSGHNPALLKRQDGVLEELTTTGIAFGVAQMDGVEIREIPFRKGDQILIYTDGLIDAQNHQEEFFKKAKVIELVQSRSFETSEALVSALLAEVNEHCRGADQFDDITLLAIKHI